MRSSCDGCGTASLPDVHYCVVCGASLREVGNQLVPSTSPPPAPLPVRRRRKTPPGPKPTPVTPVRERPGLRRILALAVTASLFVSGLAWQRWLIAGDEPPAAEY